MTEKKRPTQLSLDDNLTRDYIRIWPFDFEYSMAFIMYINKCATICVYLLGIIQIVIGKIQKVRCAMFKIKYFFFQVGLSNQLSRSAHQTPNFTNPEYFVCLLFEYFFQIKVLNQYQNSPKNANITRYIKRKKTLCNP